MKSYAAKVTLLAIVATLTSLVVATPAHAASISLHCESLYGEFVCDLDATGFREVRSVRWVVNGSSRPEFDGLGTITGHCQSSSVAPVTVVRVFVTGIDNNHLVWSLERKKTFPCECTH